MALIPEGVDHQALTVQARRVLLDALTCLQNHLPSLVLIGSQAIYLRCTDADFAGAAYTSDADVAVDPRHLEDDPRLDEALSAAGFHRDVAGRQSQPGTWFRSVEINGQSVQVPVDLLVPQSMASGNRSANLPPHAKNTARLVSGIELAVVDNDAMVVSSLQPNLDSRTVTVGVAGPAALLIAKAFKIHDRLEDPRPSRLSDKDAGDVYRLMTTQNVYSVARTLQRLAELPELSEHTRTGMAHLHHQFAGARTPGTDMAVRALGGAVTEERVRQLMPAFTVALNDALGAGRP